MNIFRISPTLACILAAALCASCVKENTEKCVLYEVRMRVVDNQGNDLTESGVLEKAEVYLFNEEGFVRMVPAGTVPELLIGEDRDERLTLVAWGNLKEDTLVTTDIRRGTPPEEARLQLRQQEGGTHIPVTDLFYCRKEVQQAVTRSVGTAEVTLVMERVAAEVSIRTRYMAQRYPYTGEPYRIIVRCAATEMDFTGKAAGDGAGYEPASTTDEAGDVSAPPFRIFPTEEGERIEIDICRGSGKLCTIAEGNDFKPLYAPAGMHTEIVIDFREAQPKTTLTVHPWGEMGQETEM